MVKYRSFTRLLVFAFVSICFVFQVPSYSKGLWVSDLWVGDFEDGRSPDEMGCGWKSAFCCDYSFDIVTTPIRGGRYGARMHLRHDDPLVNNSKRSEITRAITTDIFKDKTIFDIKGSERWYGFSDYFPTSWVNDYSGSDITMQFHTKSVDARSPPMDLVAHGNQMSLYSKWDGGSTTLWSGPLVKGQWIDWVFHIKWSSTNTGFVEVWRNGSKIVNRHGYPTIYDHNVNDEGTGEGGAFFKIGVYHGSWKNGPTDASQRVIYHDEIRVANETGSYDAVAPSTFRAVATADDTVGLAPHTVQFEGVASNGAGPYTYYWSFGDGDTAIGKNVTHTYSTPHTYVARLRIRDNTGAFTDSMYSASQVINVFDSTSFIRTPGMLYFTPDMPFRYKINYEAPGAISKTWKVYKAPSWISTAMIGQYVMGDTIPREVRIDTVVIGLDVDGIEEIKTIIFFVGKEIENIPAPTVGINKFNPTIPQQMELTVSSMGAKGLSFIIPSPSGDDVVLSVYDIFGRSLWQSQKHLKAGTNRMNWDFNSDQKAALAPGVYLILLKGSKKSIAKKVMLKFKD